MTLRSSTFSDSMCTQEAKPLHYSFSNLPPTIQIIVKIDLLTQ